MRKMPCTHLLRKVTLNRVVVISIFVVPFYNEYLSYAIYSFLWPHLRLHGTAELKILFVADPQLIGFHGDPYHYSAISRWDSDRYLHKTFQMAYSHVQPDAVVFLGDLFDEGSTSSLEEFRMYHDRLRNIFSTRNKTQHIFLPGDNDVGGEGFDQRTEMKVSRFNRFFKDEGVVTVKFADFVRLHFNYNLVDQDRNSEVEMLAGGIRTKIHVLINHMQLLVMRRDEFKPALEALHASIVFSAHSHMARLYTCLDCWAEEQLQVKQENVAGDGSRRMRPHPEWQGAILQMRDYSVYELEVNDGYTLHEIVVPTCSYRMGVPAMGYGAAVFGENNQVKYTVLWTPSRYSELYLYLMWLAFLATFGLIQLCMAACSATLRWYARRKMKY